MIGNIGLLERSYDKKRKKLTIQYANNQHEYVFDKENRLTTKQLDKGKVVEYSYDPEGQMLLEFGYDDNANPADAIVNEEGHCLSYKGFKCRYDEHGRLINKRGGENEGAEYEYDLLDRLIRITTPREEIVFTYDLFDRRISKTVVGSQETLREFYLYLGDKEIGVYDSDNQLKYLRVLGRSFHKLMPTAVAIETRERTFAPIKEIEERIGRRLDRDERRRLHDHISGQGYGYHDIVDEGYWMFNNSSYNKGAG